MFKELPTRIENASQKTSNRKTRRLHPGMIEELLHHSMSRHIEPKVSFQIVLSPLKNDYPWIYEAGMALVDKVGKVKEVRSTKAFKEFYELIEFTFENPIFREINGDEYDYRYFRELPYLIEYYLKEVSIRKMEEADDK
jgi:hypothetical protein